MLPCFRSQSYTHRIMEAPLVGSQIDGRRRAGRAHRWTAREVGHCAFYPLRLALEISAVLDLVPGPDNLLEQFLVCPASVIHVRMKVLYQAFILPSDF